jgi:hypothetical protein
MKSGMNSVLKSVLPSLLIKLMFIYSSGILLKRIEVSLFLCRSIQCAGVVEVKLHAFQILAVDGDEWYASRPGSEEPGNRWPYYIFTFFP